MFLTSSLDVANDAEAVELDVEVGKHRTVRRQRGLMSSNEPDGCHQPLALDDIMHRLSPSPGPAPDPTSTPSTCSIGLTRTVSQDITSSHVAASAATVPAVSQAVSSPRPLETSQQDSTLQADSLGHRLEPLELEPELLSPGEAQSIQSRLGELGHGPGLLSSTTASPRESELAAMVLRLLAHYHYTSERDPSEQLAAQAETIASLAAQRDMLMQQYTTASESWQAERDGWERSAEALMAQNSAASAVTKEDIVERLVARLEDENGRWTHKFAEQQRKLMSLESELLRLRPLLLIPPVAPETTKRRRHSSRRSSPQSLFSAGGPSRRSEKARADPPANVVDDGAQQTAAPKKSSRSASPSDGTHPPIDKDMSSQETVVDAKSLAGSTARSTPHLTSSQALPHDAIDKPPESSSSHYRTPREREEALAIPSPRKATPSGAPSASSNHYPRAQARIAASSQRSESTSSKQVMNPLWLASSTPHTRAEKRATSMLCDAKAELMLAAARRIGKRRVGMAAGFFPPQAAETEPKREPRGGTERASRGKGKMKAGQVDSSERGATATPPIAKKQIRKRVLRKANTVPQGSPAPSTSTASASYYASLPGMSHLVYLNPVHAGQNVSPMALPMGNGPNAVPVFMPMGGWPAMVPPTSSTSTPNTTGHGKVVPAASDATPTRPSAQTTHSIRRSESQGQSQGLDSLLNAARMLEVDGISEISGVATPTRSGGRGQRRGQMKLSDTGALDEPISTSLAKRRKVVPGTPVSAFSLGDTTPVQSPTPSSNRGLAAPGKVSSALDVLADQAAQVHERRPSAGPSSRRRSPDAPDTPTQRAPARRRQSGGRSRAGHHAGSGGAARGKQRAMVQGEPERHSSPEVSLSRKRRRSSMGVESSSKRPTPKRSVPPGEPGSPSAVGTSLVPEHIGSSSAPLPTSLESTPPTQPADSEAAAVRSTSFPPGTASSDMDAPGSPESVAEQNL